MKQVEMIITPEYGESLIKNTVFQRPLKEIGVSKIAESIRNYGWSPLSVMSIEVGKDGVHQVKAGQHRINALKKLGWPAIPVKVQFVEAGEIPVQMWMTDNMTIPQSARDNLAMLEGIATGRKTVQTCAAIVKTFFGTGKKGETAGELELWAARDMFGERMEILTAKQISATVRGVFTAALTLAPEKAMDISEMYEQVRTGIGIMKRLNAADVIRKVVKSAGAGNGMKPPTARLVFAIIMESLRGRDCFKRLPNEETVRTWTEAFRARFAGEFEARKAAIRARIAGGAVA